MLFMFCSMKQSMTVLHPGELNLGPVSRVFKLMLKVDCHAYDF